MGQRGPAPKPTALKQLEGTFRADRAQGEIFPQSPQSVFPPEHLSEPAREKWRELAPILSRNGLLTECDLDTLALYCATWVRWQDAETRLQTEGATTTAQSGYRQVSPDFTIASKSAAELRALSDRLGLSPSARGRIHIQPPPENDEYLA